MAISLSAGVRASLTSIQQTAALAQQTQLRLATGKRVNSAVDNPVNYFTSEGLNGRAGDLSRLQDQIGLAIKTIEGADKGIKALTKLVETAQGLAQQALQTSDAPTRASLATQFGTLRTQIDELAADSGFNGVNLLDGDNLTVTFNEDASSTLAVTGVTYDAAGLSIATAANAWVADADITAATDDLSAALTTLRSQASTLGANLSVVTNRQAFTSDMITTLRSGADGLVLADSNEEGANLLALNTRQQLAQTALALASQADQAVLRLF
jgi:flagellin